MPSTKEQKIKSFDPNGVGQKTANIFGLPFNCEEADIVIVPVPWEVTVSYHSGTAKGPQAILGASPQIDYYHPDFPGLWKKGIAMDAISTHWQRESTRLRKLATDYIQALENGANPKEDPNLLGIQQEIDLAGKQLNEWVKNQTSAWLDIGKIVGLLGGDHSTPLGFMDALAAKYNSFGILQIDAHMDLRKAYEGFTYSHASIMYNALKFKQLQNLVQVGIRDYCEAEVRIAESDERIQVFTGKNIQDSLMEGGRWESICMEIIEKLPENVYISFDIDGLNPALCPSTGTPVPGGLQFEQALYLIEKVAKSGRKIIGFDLVEVAPGPNEWDETIGARLLWQLCGYSSLSV